MKKGFTITELIVAVGLLAAVLAAAGMIFNYSVDAQRTAAATAEIMRTLRAITGPSSTLTLKGCGRMDTWFLWSDNSNSALYFFSTGDFQSWYDSDRRSNIARLYFGPAQNDPNILALDMRLLTPDYNGFDCSDANFAACQVDIRNYFEEPCDVLYKRQAGC